VVSSNLEGEVLINVVSTKKI